MDKDMEVVNLEVAEKQVKENENEGGGCKCGIPNADNMCVNCLVSEMGKIGGALQVIYQCPQCEYYLDDPSGTWINARYLSKELLTLCVKRLKNLSNQVTLFDAEFVPTGPLSKRIKVKLIVKINGVVWEQALIVEYDLHEKRCLPCSKCPFDEWNTKVKLRGDDDSKRSFLHLEELIVKHDADADAISTRVMDQGLDFFFARRTNASKFLSFIDKIAPVGRQGFVSKRVRGDAKRGGFNQFTFYVEMSPICCEDLICLPPKLASIKNVGPLVICTNITNTIDLLDPLTLRSCFLDGEQYFQWEFKPLLTSRQLVEYIVVSVDEVSSSNQSVYMLADVQIARVWGNVNVFTVRTHLGHILKVGDYALGYDLDKANLNSEELDKHGELILPEAILVKKKKKQIYDEKQRPPPLRRRLKKLEVETGIDDEEKKKKEDEKFLRDFVEESFNMVGLEQHKKRVVSDSLYGRRVVSDSLHGRRVAC